MKRNSLVLTIAVALCLILSVNVFAAQTVNDLGQNISFEMPDGWTQIPDSEIDSENIRYAFEKDNDEDGTYFVYSVFDLYENVSEEEKEDVERNDINNSTVTVEEYRDIIASDLESDPSISNLNVEKATVGENDYFKVTFNQEYEEGYIEDVVVYAHIYNGYETYFRYETFGELNEEDVDSIIGTVSFNGETKSNKTKTDAQKTAENVGKSALTGVLKYVLIVAVPAVIGLVARARVRRKEKKAEKNNPVITNTVQPIPVAQPMTTPEPMSEAPVQEAQPMPTPEPMSEAPAQEAQPVNEAAESASWTCPYCGTVGEGTFCANCGAKRE